jgi:hypothetical protein
MADELVRVGLPALLGQDQLLVDDSRISPRNARTFVGRDSGIHCQAILNWNTKISFLCNYGVLGLRQINTCPKVPLHGNF